MDVIIGKHIEGITLNPLEYLLDDDGNVMLFDSKKSAKEFLVSNNILDHDGICFIDNDTDLMI